MIWNTVLVAWIIIVALFVTGQVVRRRTSDEDREQLPLAIATVALLCVVLSLVGYLQLSGSTPPDQKAVDYQQGRSGRVADGLYVGIQNMAANGTVAATDPLLLRMGRVAGIGVIILLAYEAVRLVLVEPNRRGRLSGLKNHVVVCGLGRVGKQLVKERAGKDSGVVVIELDRNNVEIEPARQLGAEVLIGTATDVKLLERAGVNRSSVVFFATGSNELNLVGASRVLGIPEPNRKETLVFPEAKSKSAKAVRSVIKWTQKADKMALIAMEGTARYSYSLWSKAKAALDKFAETPQATAVEPPPQPLNRRVMVHLTDGKLDRMLQMAQDQSPQKNLPPDERLDVRSFNVVDRALRKLIEGPVLDNRPTKNGKEDYEVAHFIIFGFGAIGQRLALQLAELAHFENRHRSRMTIVYRPDEAEKVQSFRKTYPMFMSEDLPPTQAPAATTPFDAWNPWEDMDKWSFGVKVNDKQNPAVTDKGITFVVNGGYVEHEGDITSDLIFTQILGVCSKSRVKPMIFICGESDDVDSAQAVALREKLDYCLPESSRDSVIVFAYVPRRPTLTTLVKESPVSKRLVLFGDSADSCTYNDLMFDLVGPLAEAIADAYDFKYGVGPPANANPLTAAPNRVRFTDRPAWERHSNLMAAAHLNMKLQYADMKIVPWDKSIRPTDRMIYDEKKRVIAQMEHNRWLAERLLAGWGFGQRSAPNTPENRRRFAFVDWENLKDSEGVKDFEQIDRIVNFCMARKEMVVKDL